VHLSFLYVGHTHEDVDAKFSEIADKLRQNHAETIPKLIALLPNCTQITSIYNVRDWLENCLVDVRKHTKPLHFKFVMVDKVKVFYKGSVEKKWKILAGGSMFLNRDQNVSLPSGTPALCLPDFNVNVRADRLGQAVRHWVSLITEEDDNGWWASFIQRMKNLTASAAMQESYASLNASWVLPLLPRQQPVQEDIDDGEKAIPDSLQQLLNAEMEDPQVNLKYNIFTGKFRALLLFFHFRLWLFNIRDVNQEISQQSVVEGLEVELFREEVEDSLILMFKADIQRQEEEQGGKLQQEQGEEDKIK